MVSVRNYKCPYLQHKFNNMNVLERLIAFLAPESCMCCGDEGEFLCDACRLSEVVQPSAGCYRCGAPGTMSLTCKSCRRLSRLDAVWCAAPYSGISKDLVREYKYHSSRPAAIPIARSLNDITPYFQTGALYTYVPTSSKRIRERGFDHAKRLAEEVVSLRNGSLTPLLSRSFDVHQVGSSRKARESQVRGMFEAVNYNIKGREIILIDDVLTTGATLEEAARTLKKAGARKVYGLVYART